MADSEIRSPFPTMGEHGIPDSFINMSGNRSPYTKLAPKKGPTYAGPDNAGTAGHRSAEMIHEANGPKLAPQTTLYKQNASEASASRRNVKLMPSAVGNRDFWGARQFQGVRGPEGESV